MNKQILEMPALSEATREVLRAGGDDAYAKLVVDGGGGGGNDAVRGQLSALTPENVLSAPARSRDAALAVLAGLWLWHDFLDESHAISQSLHDATGSFWHAIMHRREGDFSNAKYWYARCRSHPVVAKLAYDPDDFVDDVRRASRRPVDDPDHRRAVETQRAEWCALFEECVNAATRG